MKQYDSLSSVSSSNRSSLNQSSQILKSESEFQKKFNSKTLNIAFFIFIALFVVVFVIYSLISKSFQLSRAKEELLNMKDYMKQAIVRVNDNQLILSQHQNGNSILSRKQRDITDLKEEINLIENLIKTKFLTQSSINSEIASIKQKIDDFSKRKQLTLELKKLNIDLGSIKKEITNLRAIHERNGHPPLKEVDKVGKDNQLNSKIIPREDYQFIKKALDSKDEISLELLYRMSDDGASPEDFHRKCDGIPNTLTLIKGRRITIGGFTTQKWDGVLLKTDPHAVLLNFNSEKSFNVINPKSAIKCNPLEFPYFGIGDLYIENKVCHTSFPSNFGINADDQELTEGYYQFSIDEMEVFRVLFY